MDLNDLIEAYEQQMDEPWDFMETLMVPGDEMTFGYVVELYCKFMNATDGDKFYRHTDTEIIDLVTGERQDIPDNGTFIGCNT